MKLYYELDARGKFFRTLWILPFLILMTVILYLVGFSVRAIAIWGFISFFGFLIQLGVNYNNWKNNEQKEHEENNGTDN